MDSPIFVPDGRNGIMKTGGLLWQKNYQKEAK